MLSILPGFYVFDNVKVQPISGFLCLSSYDTKANIDRGWIAARRIFFGVEEWDYSLNVMRKGYHLYFVPKSVAYHLATGSVEVKSTKYHYNFYRNKLIFQRKHLPPLLFFVWKTAFRIYAYLILPVRTSFIHKGLIPPRSMVFAAKNAISDQKGLEPVQLSEVNDFEIRLARSEGLNS